MFSFFINLLLVALAFFELAWGLLLLVREKGFSTIKNFVPIFTVFSVMICGGYGLMGLIPDISKAFLPRFFGLWGCVALFLTEFTYILFDIGTNRLTQYITIGPATVWAILDLVIYGKKSAVNYIRGEFSNTIEIADSSSFIFHYIFLGVLGLSLLILSVKWYKSKKIKRERRFVVQIIIANYIVLFATLPNFFSLNGSVKYSTISYSIALSVNFFVWMSALQQKMAFNMTLTNVSEGIFYTIDVPIIIFSENGNVSLFNPCAQEFLGLKDSQKVSIRDLFKISDVEEMRLMAKAKRGEDYQLKVTDKASEKACLLKCSVKLDYAGEPYCIIGIILTNSQDLNNEEGNL